MKVINFNILVSIYIITLEKFLSQRLLANVTMSSTSSSVVSSPSLPNNNKILPHPELIKNITEKHRCESIDDCSGNGKCDLNFKMCFCDYNYETYIEDYVKIVDDTQIQKLKMCNYEKKSQLTALMLSLFVGFGSEHFYMNKIDIGIAKLCFYLVCCVGNIILFVIYMCFPNHKHLVEFLGKFEANYMACGFIVSILWIIYDLVRIGNMSMLDGKGIPLSPW